MRINVAALAACLLIAISGWAATPEGNNDSTMPVFRVTTAEVHVAFTAVSATNQPVSSLSASDFVVMRDGRSVGPLVSFGAYHQAPLSVLMLVDVSDSMLPGLALERAASRWLEANSDASHDRLSILDFGDEVQSAKNSKPSNRHMTSLYDALMETLPTIITNGIGRRALILLTDGDDNYSNHTLRDVIAEAQRYDVAIYAVTAHPNRKQHFSPDVLQRLCEQTGGRYFEVRKADAMKKAMSQINEELRNGYELVFRPDPTRAGLHLLTIRPAQSGTRFFYRSGYFQPAAGGPEIASGE